MFFVHRFELQGCNDTLLADLNSTALATMAGVELPIIKSAKGRYVVAVESGLGHLNVLNQINRALAPYRVLACSL
jgi:hypothetical protein